MEGGRAQLPDPASPPVPVVEEAPVPVVEDALVPVVEDDPPAPPVVAFVPPQAARRAHARAEGRGASFGTGCMAGFLPHEAARIGDRHGAGKRGQPRGLSFFGATSR